MGALPTIFSIIGVSLCWLPLVGWLGVGFSLAACGFGVPFLIYESKKAGYTGWAIAGISIGLFATALGLAYQIKHADGQLDMIYYPLSVSSGIVIGLTGLGLLGAAIWAGHKYRHKFWVALGYAAILGIAVSMGFAMLTVDRLM